MQKSTQGNRSENSTKQRGIRWQTRHTDWLMYAAIAAALFGLLLVFGGKKSFFSDEMDQVGVLASCSSFGDLLGLYARVGHEVAPPLFAALAWCWYQIVPHTQAWLQVLPALLTCGGVYVMGLAGRALGGRVMGVLAAAFSLFASAVTLTAGMQLRQYGALLLFAALTTYLYVRLSRKKPGEKESWGLILLYGVSMALLPYTHYVSVLLPVGFGIVDCIGVIKMRLRPHRLISYALGAGLFLPWAIAIFSSVANRSEFWIEKPRLNDLITTLYFLTDGQGPGLLFYLFILGGCLGATLLLFRRKQDSMPEAGDAGILERRQGWLVLALACVPLFMMDCVFVYSAYLSPNISLYLPRYFISAIPAILLVAAYAAKRLMDLLTVQAAAGGWNARALTAAICAFFFIAALLHAEETVRTDVNTQYEPYREAADWLMEQPDIHDADVAVATSNLSAYVTLGWETLYVTRDGKRQSFPIYDYAHGLTAEAAAEYQVLYTFVEHAALPPDVQTLLAESYTLDDTCVSGHSYGVRRYLRRALEN